MKRWSQNEGTRRHLWNRALILPLCACLVLAGSVTHPVWSSGASEDERLHDQLLRGQEGPRGLQEATASCRAKYWTSRTKP